MVSNVPGWRAEGGALQRRFKSVAREPAVKLHSVALKALWPGAPVRLPELALAINRSLGGRCFARFRRNPEKHRERGRELFLGAIVPGDLYDNRRAHRKEDRQRSYRGPHHLKDPSVLESYDRQRY